MSILNNPKFSLISAGAKLRNLNIRAEKHGEDRELAADLSLEVTSSNNVLSEFHPALKSAFYQKESANVQGELINDANHLPERKFPQIHGIRWDQELDNYKAVIHIGIGGISDVTMLDCKVNKFHFQLKEGGSVATGFRLQCHPSPEEVGKLSKFVDQEISISLVHVPPAANEDMADAA